MAHKEQPELYSNIVESLVASVMLAQREYISALKLDKQIADVPDAAVNRHFSWLALEIAEGTNRHLIDPGTNQFPLRTSALRNIKGTPASILSLLRKRLAPDGGARWTVRTPPKKSRSVDMSNVDSYIRFEPTRISSLIRSSFKEFNWENWKGRADDDLPILQSPPTDTKNWFTVDSPIVIRSALSIVYDFLTVPGLPATRAYALVSLRNYIFGQCGAIPIVSSQWKPSTSSAFNTRDIGDALSRVNTSTRERFYSLGRDPLPPFGKHVADSVLRQFLLMKGWFNCRFHNLDACLVYLAAERTSGPIVQRKLRKVNDVHARETYELVKRPQVAKLPELGEIVNELLGLPIPLRGAETVFQGGLKFTLNEGLVIALHGGPGSGKTSLALGVCACVAPFGIDSLFISAEEHEDDLRSRMFGLIPEEVRRLSFFGEVDSKLVQFEKIGLARLRVSGESVLPKLVAEIRDLANALESRRKEALSNYKDDAIPKPCTVVVVLDGLHDLFAVEGRGASNDGEQRLQLLYQLIEALRELKALVIVTTGAETVINSSLDYLVDVAIHLSHESVAEYSAKPDRRIKLTKARHQLAAIGTHGLQIAGLNGVRLSPQINYQLDRRAIWKLRIPETTAGIRVLRSASTVNELEQFAGSPSTSRSMAFRDQPNSATIFAGSHVFINGQGSSGKAALALKLALAPLLPTTPANHQTTTPSPTSRRVLVVSFLYPLEYYANLARRIQLLHRWEYGIKTIASDVRLRVIHLHPGHMRPNDLYNKIDWALEAAELEGAPFTSVVIDGIHNVFVQFPEIQRYSLFWPQLYNSLRSRGILTITTHTILRAPETADQTMSSFRLDDDRSEPLRNALVQKTDFQIEVYPFPKPLKSTNSATQDETLTNLFVVKTVSAIGQPIPKNPLLWSREELILVEDPRCAGKVTPN
jgi:KaiC/GvpD/RAD55 family RecA-like ATPase